MVSKGNPPGESPQSIFGGALPRPGTMVAFLHLMTFMDSLERVHN